MTYTFNMHEAKTKLSKLVELIESGEKVLIARDGTVVAELIEATAPTRPLLGEFKPVKVHSVSDREEKQMQFEIEEAMARKDRILIELMNEIANEQSAA